MRSAMHWKRIVDQASQSDLEISTVPHVRKTPLWFRVHSDGNVVYIHQATDHSPSSKLKMPRSLVWCGAKHDQKVGRSTLDGFGAGCSLL